MIARILDKSEEAKWEKFAQSHPLATIHQSPTWGHFQKTIPSRGKYWILALESDDKIIGGTMLIRHKLPKGYTWLYSARGPLLDYKSPDLPHHMEALLEQIRTIAKKEKSIFYRIDPPLQKSPNLPKFKPTEHGFQPTHTLLLDLTKSEEQLLKEMKPKGRYNIRLAAKKGVKITKSDPANEEQFQKQIDAYHDILLETTTRDGFSAHSKKFYANMVKTLHEDKKGDLYLALFEGQIIAGLITTYYNKTTTYYYGASGNTHRNLMAPYLLQWTAIKDAKAKHHVAYDFLGIAPENAHKHPWEGVTQFKTKFGGTRASYSKALDYPLKPLLYLLYNLHKRLR